jgi:drug/metabolite transporter (DMT)-like permease
MAVLLAALSSVAFGGADFLGGLTSRRAPAVTVVFTAHLAGLVVVLAVAPLWGSEGALGSAVLWGAAAGASGAAGLVMLYHALATTRFSIAAPAAALFGAVMPVGYGLVIGERPAALAWVGVLVAIPALLLITSTRREDSDAVRSGARRAVAWGALAGFGFALFGIFISRTTDASGLWPLVGARAASIPAMALLALGLRRPLVAAPPVLGAALVVGVADMGANILYLAALHRGLVSLVVVISSLYPAATVLLARMVLNERLTRRQVLGLGLAGLGIALIAAA